MDINLEIIKNRSLEIQNLIGDDNLESAFRKVLDYANDFGDEDSVIDSVGKMRKYSKLKKDERKEVISRDDYELHISRLIEKTLELVIFILKQNKKLNDE